MTIIKTIDEFKNIKPCSSLGFVPTMGALHSGHLSLIQKSVEQNEKTCVSIFVNPTQFLEGEDIDSYPRQSEQDLDICKRAGVDYVFMPEHMYSEEEPSVIAPPIKGYMLEGYNRPGHFDGVLSVVLKLLNLVKPTRAYFGKKDAQQLYLVQNMVKNFFLPCEIVPCEIVRDTNGLALSSRNAYLNESELKEALKLSKSLKVASEMIVKGRVDGEEIKSCMLEVLKPLKVDYVAIVSRDFKELKEIELKNSIILVAAHVGKARLIDNMWV